MSPSAGASRRPRLLVASTITALALTILAPSAGLAPPALAATYAQLVGQKLVVAMSGTTPSAALLARISRGEVGGVILFGSNITSAAQLHALTSRLAAAAASGGQPRLLIGTDQEGGSVKRVPWAPPTLSVPQMGASGSSTTARSQGQATAHALLCGGIDANLAPVADVPASTSSFMYQQGRTWSFSATTTATLSDAFASGLGAGGNVAAMKHFPGIGMATQNTDTSVVTIGASASALAPGLAPYKTAIGHAIPLVMLSNATYTAYDSANAAGWSRAISVGLLRTTLGFRGVSITDSLTGTAAARGVSATSLAIKAAIAGTDMLLLTGTEASTSATYTSLVNAAANGTIPLATLQASYARILAMKAAIPAPIADAAAPSVSAPASQLVAGTTLGASTMPVRTRWSASDPCGIAAYTVERLVAGGSWVVQPLPAQATSVTQSLALGTVYRYVQRATDDAGNSSPWVYGAYFEPLLTQQTSGYVRYAGTWTTAWSSAYSGGSTRYATAAGASASYTFTASSVGWVSAVGPTRGSAALYLDGNYWTTISTYAATAGTMRIAAVANWPSQGTHTLRIVVLGTAGHPRVDLDGFVRLYRP